MQETGYGVSLGPDNVRVSRLNSSITRLYQSTSQPSAAVTTQPIHVSSAPTDIKIPTHSAVVPPLPTGACAQPASQTIVSSSHSGAAQPTVTPQAQPRDAGADVKASHLEDERSAGAKTNKKRGKAHEGRSKSLKRVRDSAGEAGPAAKRASIVTPRRIFYSDLGGIDDVLTDIRHLIEYPLMHPEVCTPAIDGHPQPTQL